MTRVERDAAAILRAILRTLPFPAPVAAYLRGYADGLEAQPRANTVRKS